MLSVKTVTYSSPHHSKGNSKIERWFRNFRRVLFLTLRTFSRSNHWDIFFQSLALVNNTPLLSLKKFCTDETMIPSPTEMYFSIRPRNNILMDQINTMSPKDHQNWVEEYQKIIKSYDKSLEEEHQLEVSKMKIRKEKL